MDNIEEIKMILERIRETGRALPNMDLWLDLIADTQRLEKLLESEVKNV